MTPRASVLARANQIIHGERQQDYGTPDESFSRTAVMWAAYKGVTFDSRDVAIMLALLKINRIAHSPTHADSYVDLCGYAALAGELAGVEVG